MIVMGVEQGSFFKMRLCVNAKSWSIKQELAFESKRANAMACWGTELTLLCKNSTNSAW
jgi:hypothetical protein